MTKPASHLFVVAVKQCLNAIDFLRRRAIADGHAEEYYSARAIADAIGVAETSFQRNIIQLARYGIIETKRGPKGGFRITAKQLTTFTLLDIIYYSGQEVPKPSNGDRASDKLDTLVYDILSVSLEDFLALE